MTRDTHLPSVRRSIHHVVRLSECPCKQYVVRLTSRSDPICRKGCQCCNCCRWQDIKGSSCACVKERGIKGKGVQTRLGPPQAIYSVFPSRCVCVATVNAIL